MAVKVPLTQGRVALVSECDAERVLPHKWFARQDSRIEGRFYACRNKEAIDGQRGTILMHRFIMAPAKGLVVDHINGDGLDNRRENLRLCTHQENLAKGHWRKPNKSGFRGVQKYADDHFVARICVSQKLRHIGTFRTATEAARAYDAAATEHFGDFAYLNFPEEA